MSSTLEYCNSLADAGFTSQASTSLTKTLHFCNSFPKPFGLSLLFDVSCSALETVNQPLFALELSLDTRDRAFQLSFPHGPIAFSGKARLIVSRSYDAEIILVALRIVPSSNKLAIATTAVSVRTWPVEVAKLCKRAIKEALVVVK